MSIFAEVVYELNLKDLENFKRGGDGVFRQKEVCELSRSIVLDYAVALEYRQEEGVCFSGEEIRLEGKFRVDHGSLFVFNG